MAYQNDDWDIRKAWMYTEAGGNGDFYVTISAEDKGLIRSNTIRVTTSGSRYPSEVMLAVANLYRAMEKYGLNDRTLNKDLEFKQTMRPVDSGDVDERSVARNPE